MTTKIRELNCGADIVNGRVILQSGASFDLAGLLDTLSELREYADLGTLEEYKVSRLIADADVYLEFFS